MSIFTNTEIENLVKEALTPLCEIMNKYGSDKGTTGQGTSGHNYTKLYHHLFNDIRNDELKVLEVGIGSVNPELQSNMAWSRGYKPGASLRGWKEYFPNAFIYGCDFDEATLFSEDRIKTFYIDQRSQDIILDQVRRNIKNVSFDIIIDDGLHECEVNLLTFACLYNSLKIGGTYIIEDLDPRAETLINNSGMINKLKEVGDLVQFVNLVSYSNIGDSCCLIVKKKAKTQIRVKTG
ncbi:Uncharacterised protein [uncultured archaeon]|nr:Uncharacterised protein [uncultured archaeon]